MKNLVKILSIVTMCLFTLALIICCVGCIQNNHGIEYPLMVDVEISTLFGSCVTGIAALFAYSLEDN